MEAVKTRNSSSYKLYLDFKGSCRGQSIPITAFRYLRKMYRNPNIIFRLLPFSSYAEKDGKKNKNRTASYFCWLFTVNNFMDLLVFSPCSGETGKRNGLKVEFQC